MSSSVLGLNNVKIWQIFVRAQSFDSYASSGDALFSNNKKISFQKTKHDDDLKGRSLIRFNMSSNPTTSLIQCR